MDYADVCAENSTQIGMISTEKFQLKLKHDIPINLRPYRTSVEDQKIIDEIITELLHLKIIQHSTSPYSSPIVLVGKKDEGGKSRMCINYIKLNEITETESYPMPRIEDIQDRLLDARVFTAVDIASGFWHIPVKEEDIPKTAFTSNHGHYEWLRMPFGLKNAPIVFQRVVANLLMKHEMNSFAVNYIDDIIIFSKNAAEHLHHLKQLFEMARAEGIKFKISKCQFMKKEINYLGHRIEHNTIRPLQDNVAALKKVPPPKDLRSLRGFLGKINYYTKFVPNRAMLFHPLYQLLKKNVEWNWTEECQAAYEKVKEILTTSPAITIFNPRREIVIYTDASNIGIGAVLKQYDKNYPKLEDTIGYFSKPLLKYQINYSTVEHELLAILSAIEHWHFYLIGRKFLVRTDHQALKSLHRFKKPNTRLFNWALRLQQYDFKVEYLSGAQNEEADFLSRNPVEMLNEITIKGAMWIEQHGMKMYKEDIKNNFDSLIQPVNNVLSSNESDENVNNKEKEGLTDEEAKTILTMMHYKHGHPSQQALRIYFHLKYYNKNIKKTKGNKRIYYVRGKEKAQIKF